MVIDTPFGRVIQLGVLSMNMTSPGHRVPEIMSSPLFVFLSERNGSGRYDLVLPVTGDRAQMSQR